ncbi:MAG: DHH family phosphoesterase [Oligoflexia bacterium]|nr:DHH family phosphoesterase [Oligoflexia bacterium]
MHLQLSDIRDLILKNDFPVFISAHAFPDGDALGSEVALAHALESINKNARIINRDSAPLPFSFLQKYHKFSSPENITIPESAFFIFLDVCETEKLGSDVVNIIGKVRDKKIIFIDHHRPKIYNEDFHYFINDDASCTGEIIFDLLTRELGIPLDQTIAEAIYTAIISDTRSFRYSKTTSKSHKIAASLIDSGIETEKIQQKVFSSNNINQIQLLGYVLSNTRLSENKKVAYVFLPHRVMSRYHLLPMETKGFINHLLTIKNVEIAVLLREDRPDHIKVSLRSKKPYPIDTYAEKYGGGGKKFGASFSLKNINEQTRREIIGELEIMAGENPDT